MSEYVDRLIARHEATVKLHGIALPVVDYEDATLRDRLGCDEDLLAKAIVEHFAAEHNAFEVIITAVGAGGIEVLFAAMTKDLRRKFREYRLVVTPAYSIVSSVMTFERDDRVIINTPRWATRKP